MFGDQSFQIFLLLMANFDQLGLIDNFDKEYGCYRPNSQRNVSDQFVLELLIGHC